jgi:hypothetical protein
MKLSSIPALIICLLTAHSHTTLADGQRLDATLNLTAIGGGSTLAGDGYGLQKGSAQGLGVGVAWTWLRPGYDRSVGLRYDFIATDPQSHVVTVPLALQLKFANFRLGAATGLAAGFFTQNGIQSHVGGFGEFLLGYHHTLAPRRSFDIALGVNMALMQHVSGDPGGYLENSTLGIGSIFVRGTLGFER